MTPGYFELLHLEVLRGRRLRDSDRPDAPPVAVVNRVAAERWWPGDSPVGRRVRFEAESAPGGGEWIEVVGVIENEVRIILEEPTSPEIYLPAAQSPRSALTLVTRPRGEALDAVAAIRQEIWAVDPSQPVSDVATIEQLIRNERAGWRVVISLFGMFAVFALVMASAGIYAVLSFAVSRRTREIGIRSALGARAAQVLRTIVGQSVVVVAIGIVVGLAAGYGLTRVLAAALPELSAAGPATQVASALVLGTVAVTAAWLPATRAITTDPVRALREE